MIYALINNGFVENVIVADSSFISLINSNWQHCVQIDSADPMPAIGWSYDGSNFSPPVEE